MNEKLIQWNYQSGPVFQDSTIKFIHNNNQYNVKNKFLIVSDSILMLGPPKEYALGTVSKYKKVSE